MEAKLFRSVMIVIIVAGVILGSLGVHTYRSYQVEEKTIEFVALQDSLNSFSQKYGYQNSLFFRTPNGKTISLDRRDIPVVDKDALDKIWNNLHEGDVVVLEHYIEYWKIFGKMITKKHVDNFRLKVEKN